jgi:hypothetical protein
MLTEENFLEVFTLNFEYIYICVCVRVHEREQERENSVVAKQNGCYH